MLRMGAKNGERCEWNARTLAPTDSIRELAVDNSVQLHVNQGFHNDQTTLPS